MQSYYLLSAGANTNWTCACKHNSPGTQCGSAPHPEDPQLMTPEPLIPKPTSQVYVAVDPSSVVEYSTAGAFTTTGGGPQSVTKDIIKMQFVWMLLIPVVLAGVSFMNIWDLGLNRSSSGMIRLSNVRPQVETVVNWHVTVSLLHTVPASLWLSSRLTPVSKWDATELDTGCFWYTGYKWPGLTGVNTGIVWTRPYEFNSLT